MKLPLSAKMSGVVDWINSLEGVEVYSVDVPTGIDATTGATGTSVVRAKHSITFSFPKIGMFLPPASESIGKRHCSQIGFDWASVAAQSGMDRVEILDETPRPEWKQRFSPRKQESNKGDFGHVAILAGSRGMVGAAALVARAAQRSGAGLVTLLTAESAQMSLAIKLDEQMTLPLPEKNGAVSLEAFDQILDFAKRATCFCIGPGLTASPEISLLIRRLLRELRLPVVLDADGLNALATGSNGATEPFEPTEVPLILTPHPGEAARLLDCTTEAIQEDRLSAVLRLAERYQATVLLKGRYTLISDPSGKILINTTGNPGMAAGGMEIRSRESSARCLQTT